MSLAQAGAELELGLCLWLEMQGEKFNTALGHLSMNSAEQPSVNVSH